MTKLTDSSNKKIISRRTMLKGSAAALSVAAATGVGGFPTLWAQDIKDIEIRMLGSAVSHQKPLEEMAVADTGLNIQQTVVDYGTIMQRAATQPRGWDIAEPAYQQLPGIWPLGNCRAVDTRRLKHWDKVIGLYKSPGKIWDDASYGQGMNPSLSNYTSTEDGTDFAVPESTPWLTLLPGNHNADTLGARLDIIGRPIESWAEFINPEFTGRTGLQNYPDIGLMDVAMAMEAAEMITYSNKGDMTLEEIDFTFNYMIDLKKKGHFRAFWTTFMESVNFMLSGETVIQSMWSPAVTVVKSNGVPCVYLDLKEGYRSWTIGSLISKHVEDGKKLDAIYDLFDWYYSGPAGAYFARQGYYMPTPEHTRKYLDPYEWDFWYEGKAATQDINNPFGQKLEPAGALRDGGSWKNRMGRVAVWNSTMKENAYVIKRWNEFLTA